MNDVLSTNIQFIKGVGPKLAKVLSKKGIQTLEDALYFVPRAYEDRRNIVPIAQLVPGRAATVFGSVSHQRSIRQGRRNRLEVTLTDGTGSVLFTWFHAFPGLKEEFKEGVQVLAFGEPRFFRGMATIAHPEYEIAKDLVNGKPTISCNFGRVVPIYSETEGLHQKTLRRVMREVIRTSTPAIQESLPDDLRGRLQLPTLKKSFVAVHFPEEFPEEGNLSQALRRIVFEEFFVLQLGLGLKKREREKARAPRMREESLLHRFLSTIPFELTEDQQTVIQEVQADLAKQSAMVRLVQGDVGAGKTVVAFASAAVAAGSGYQSALMAPTELLAQQHFKSAQKLLSPLGVKVALLTQGTSSIEVEMRIREGGADLVIGTHSLFQQSIRFQNLGLVIVDEQHRFGVEQRSELVRKGVGSIPHLLMMTATPIPRTLAFTLYGDLDLSIIRQKPKGRQPVKTSIFRDRDRPRLYQKIRERVKRGEQVYVIYPLIEKSEKLELKSATEMYQRLKQEVFPEFSMLLLHGKMKPEEKDSALLQFKEGKAQILVSTTVIEVGIDIPNATLMVIEHPERLGLSQLHQLRGRVGRGTQESECILVAEKFVTERLRVMEKTEDGFVIAEEDLKIRGPGEFLGTRQSGLLGFRVGNLLRDASLLVKAREEAERILVADPGLEKNENAAIRAMVESRWKEKIERLRGG